LARKPKFPEGKLTRVLLSCAKRIARMWPQSQKLANGWNLAGIDAQARRREDSKV